MQGLNTTDLGIDGIAAADHQGHREYTFVASTGDRMRSRVRLNPDGWNLDNYMRNPVVLPHHAGSNVFSAPQNPIGQATRVWIDHRGLMARIRFASTDAGKETEQLVLEGVIRAVSVGWLGSEFSLDRNEDGTVREIAYNQQELIEISVVNVPADPHALRVADLSNTFDEATLNTITAAFRQQKANIATAPAF